MSTPVRNLRPSISGRKLWTKIQQRCLLWQPVLFSGWLVWRNRGLLVGTLPMRVMLMLTSRSADPGNCQLGFGRCDSDTTPAGVSTINDPRPHLGSVSYTDDIIDCVQDNVVALTFD